MQCGDLERYLEAFLDGRLGRTRTGIVRRHLASCVGCRLRLEKLRHFERDFNRRLRVAERVDSMWAGLEPDLVGSTQTVLPIVPPPLRLLPPPASTIATRSEGAARPEPALTLRPEGRGGRRRLAPRLAGALLIVGVVGVTGQAVRLLIVSPDPETVALRSYLDQAGSQDRLPLETGDPELLRGWLATQTGVAFPTPPAPAGFTLGGAKVERQGGIPTAVVVYSRAGTTSVLRLEARDDGQSTVPPTCTRAGDALTSLKWSRSGFDYALLSALPPTELGGFVPGALVPACG